MMNKKVFAAPAMFVLVAAIVAMTTPVNAVYAGGHNGGHNGGHKGGHDHDGHDHDGHDHDGHNGGHKHCYYSWYHGHKHKHCFDGHDHHDHDHNHD